MTLKTPPCLEMSTIVARQFVQRLLEIPPDAKRTQNNRKGGAGKALALGRKLASFDQNKPCPRFKRY